MHLSARQDEITKELSSAAFAFYVSIFALILLGLPLLVHIIPTIAFELFLSNLGLESHHITALTSTSANSKPDTEIVISAATRFLILVPGIWLVRITGRRYDRLFRLREHYAYKYSIATSVEGFQRQSPNHRQELAAFSFGQLAFNPAERMDGTPDDTSHPNPLLEKFMGFLEGKTKKVQPAGVGRAAKADATDKT